MVVVGPTDFEYAVFMVFSCCKFQVALREVVIRSLREVKSLTTKLTSINHLRIFHLPYRLSLLMSW
jgi:hypothetical protein